MLPIVVVVFLYLVSTAKKYNTDTDVYKSQPNNFLVRLFNYVIINKE